MAISLIDAGSAEVTESITNIAGVSEENSAAAEEMNKQVEEVSDSAQALAQMAVELDAIVNQFQLSTTEKSAGDDLPHSQIPERVEVPANIQTKRLGAAPVYSAMAGLTRVVPDNRWQTYWVRQQ